MPSAQQSLPTGYRRPGQGRPRCNFRPVRPQRGVVPHFSSPERLLVAREPFRLCRSLTVAACLRKTTNSRGIYFLAGNTQRPVMVTLRPRRARSRAELMARHGRATSPGSLLVVRGCNGIKHFAGRAFVRRRWRTDSSSRERCRMLRCPSGDAKQCTSSTRVWQGLLAYYLR